jgi:hypothetical protein
MRIMNRLTTLLIFAVLLLSAVVCLAVAISPAWGHTIEGFLPGNKRVTLACAGAAMFFLAILMPLTSGGRKKQLQQKERILSFSNDEGTISISTVAISDYLSKLGTEFPSIIKMQPIVVPRHKAVDIIVVLRVKAGPQIHEIYEVLQRRVRETMVNGLGISDVRKVEVSVKEISPEHKGD